MDDRTDYSRKWRLYDEIKPAWFRRMQADLIIPPESDGCRRICQAQPFQQRILIRFNHAR